MNRNVLAYYGIVLGYIFVAIFLMAFYSGLPDEIAVHFNSEGVADGFGNKSILPILYSVSIVLNVLLVYVIAKFYRDKIPLSFILSLMYVIFFVFLVVIVGIVAIEKGWVDSITIPIIVLIGLELCVLGNNTTKLKQNNIAGLRTRATLSDEDTWYKAHRILGFSMFIGGVVIIATAFLENLVVSIVIAIIVTLLPLIYVYKPSGSKREEC